MNAETDLIFPYQELQQFDEFCSSNASLAISNSFGQTSIISDYNLGGEGDLFQAPEPVIAEPPLVQFNPLTSAISMISRGADAISPQLLTVTDVESLFENGLLLNEMFYECRNDLWPMEWNDAPLSEVLDVKVSTDVAFITGDECPFQKSFSSSCSGSVESVNVAPLRPNFLDFPALDFGAVYGMRRAFSEGDIKALGSGTDINLIQSPVEQQKIMSSSASEVRMEKLSRYRSKKSKRNFGRKIKYACRKALADSQPRIRGRFAKTKEMM